MDLPLPSPLQGLACHARPCGLPPCWVGYGPGPRPSPAARTAAALEWIAARWASLYPTASRLLQRPTPGARSVQSRPASTPSCRTCRPSGCAGCARCWTRRRMATENRRSRPTAECRSRRSWSPNRRPPRLRKGTPSTSLAPQAKSSPLAPTGGEGRGASVHGRPRQRRAPGLSSERPSCHSCVSAEESRLAPLSARLERPQAGANSVRPRARPRSLPTRPASARTPPRTGSPPAPCGPGSRRRP